MFFFNSIFLLRVFSQLYFQTSLVPTARQLNSCGPRNVAVSPTQLHLWPPTCSAAVFLCFERSQTGKRAMCYDTITIFTSLELIYTPECCWALFITFFFYRNLICWGLPPPLPPSLHFPSGIKKQNTAMTPAVPLILIRRK